ncbi:MAG TPA: cellulose synthase complex periplasmic endoglucanase BcsZ [Rhodocyclaceae bacterium]|nr:cellulose synthase complex periplasmic endoglucanase BcsZ [Rhodocyclaceae bacterium]
MKPLIAAFALAVLGGLISPMAPGALAADAAPVPACGPWPAWESFRGHFLNEGGRVVDSSTPEKVTTSEGQSYGLFYALVSNDRASFDRILRWTEDNLAGGDLTARLPAWQWGQGSDGQWGVLDSNAASDSDLWIAYVLLEAGRLWQSDRYTAIGELLAQRILREEVTDLPKLGPTMLPGPKGFAFADHWRLNPSYVPVQLLRRMALAYPKSAWPKVLGSSMDVLVRSAPRGLSPDWVGYSADKGFQADEDTKGVGSYNAIRVYLWAGMLPADEPLRGPLLKTLAPMARLTATVGTPPLETDTRQGAGTGIGPTGFSAALLPFLSALGDKDALRAQRLRVEARDPLSRDDNYYEQALTLFGLGWMEGRFRFGRDGRLLPNWTCAGK